MKNACRERDECYAGSVYSSTGKSVPGLLFILMSAVPYAYGYDFLEKAYVVIGAISIVYGLKSRKDGMIFL